jgi:hypothetical protein
VKVRIFERQGARLIGDADFTDPPNKSKASRLKRAFMCGQMDSLQALIRRSLFCFRITM